MSAISIVIQGLALVPISWPATVTTKPQPGTESSRVGRTLTSLVGVGLAASYCCAIAALKVWAKFRPRKAAR